MQTYMTNLRKFENENKIESTCVRERLCLWPHDMVYVYVHNIQQKYHKIDKPNKEDESKKRYKRSYTEIKSDSRFKRLLICC